MASRESLRAAPAHVPAAPLSVQQEIEFPEPESSVASVVGDVHVPLPGRDGRWSKRIGQRTWVGVAAADELLVRRSSVHKALEELPVQVDKRRRRYSAVCGVAVVFGISTRVTRRADICLACFGDGW